MARFTLPKLFRSMAFKPKNIRRKLHHSTLFLETFEERVVPALPPPQVILNTTQESITPLPEILPTATNNETTTIFIDPQTVADPVNPAYQVLVATGVSTSPNVTGTTYGVYAVATVDNGTIWVPVNLFGNDASLANSPDFNPTEPVDPTVVPTTTFPNGVPYTNASSVSVAFGRNGEVYFTYLVSNATQTSGAVVFEKGTFDPDGIGTVPNYTDSVLSFVTGLPLTPGTAASKASSAILYQWTGVDPAENPVVAVDNNLPSYTDPVTGKTVTDPMDSASGLSAGVYVAWNGDSTVTPDDQTTTSFNETPIFAVVSAKDGTGGTWSNPSPVNADGYLAGQSYSDGAPQISFSPASSGAPGALVFVWPHPLFTTNAVTQLATDVTQPDNGVASDVIPQAYTATDNAVPVTIANGTTNPNSPPTYDSGVTKVNFTVTAANSGLPSSGTPAFSLQDLSIGLSVVDPNLDELSISLTAPNGQSVTLLNSRLDNNGNTVPQGGLPFLPGLPPPPAPPTPLVGGLGVDNSIASETIFDDTAARDINDPTAAFPYIGTYKADGGTNILTALGLTGATAAKLEGKWTLTFTDFVMDSSAPTQFLNSWNLTFSTIKESEGFGNDSGVPTTDTVTGDPDYGAGGTPTLSSSLTNGNQTALPASVDAGIPVAPSVAFDTSVGSASPYAGTIYIAYTGVVLNTSNVVIDTNIYMTAGTLSVTGGTVSINFTSLDQVNDDSDDGEARPAFTPAVAVDSSTGTVVLTWYDTRLDASAVRAAEFIATSTDGGLTYSSQTFSTSGEQPFLNEPVGVTDIVTGTSYNIQPIPTNIQAAGTQGVGIRQSLIVHNGIIDADWSGNFDYTDTGIFGGEAIIADGSRVVSGDLGPVNGPSTAGGYDTLGDQLGFTVATALTIVASPTGATEVGHTVTIMTTAAGPALFEVGQTVTIAGVGVAKYDGTFKITGVISPTEFTYTDATANLAASGGGTVTSAAGQLFQEEYNTHMGSDGTQGIDGFVVTLDRLINPDQFIGLTSAELSAIFTVEYRSPYTPLSLPATQVMVSSVEVFTPADTSEISILVHFATPQYAVGTYSYSVGPDIVDQVQTLQSVYYSPQVPVPISSPTPALTVTVPPTYDQTGVIASVAVPTPPAGTPPITGVAVTVSMTFSTGSSSNVKLVLIGPDGTRVVLMNFGDANGGDLIGTTFADYGTTKIATSTLDAYNGTVEPDSPLSAFVGKQVGGTWSLQVVDDGSAGSDAEFLDTFSLQFTYPAYLQVATTANGGATEAGSTVTIKTTESGNYAVGQQVTIGGMGVAGYDGTFTITAVPSATSFTYTNTVTGLAASGGGYVTAAAATQTIAASPTGAVEAAAVNGISVVTIKTTAASPIPVQVGDQVTIAGVGVAGYDGTYTVTGVLSSTSFTYNTTDTGLAASGGGTVVVSSLTANDLGNEMDQSATDMPGQGAPISGGNPFATESSVFSMPTATSGVPFTVPYAETTEPLIIAGPHVDNFYAVSTTVVTVGSVATGTPGTIDITLNRPFDASTLGAGDILSLIDPNGNEVFANATLAPFTVAALVSNTLLPITSGATNVLQITLPIDLATGQVYTALTGSYTIELDQGVVPADYETVGSAVSTTEITFDREMNWPTSPNYNAANPVFSPSNIVSITGPAGVIYDRATAASDPLTVSLATTGDYRDFIIGFPGQILSGTYSIVIDPEFAAATLVSGQEELIDTNENAGLDVLRGTATPSTGTPVSNTYTATFSGASSTIPAQIGSIPGSASFPIDITDAYPITISAGHQIEVQLNISSTAAESQNVVDLTADLISPSGTVLQLFTDVGNPLRTPGTLWFSNTVLEDSANTPIQEGFQPFDSGPYNPQFSLDNAFNGESATGMWTLRISNDGKQTPNLTSWSLILPEITPGSGMGETYADQITATFTVFTENPTNTLTQDVWAAVGPEPQNNGAGTNIAQTNAIAVDPSDPSGNTVYIGAATGGVWKTTDYLTTNPLGPTWIPLTDNGLINGLNIVSIAVFPRNGNPEQSIIYALTGDGNLKDSMANGEVGSSGVGVLRSEDGGQTWVLLDSTNNEDASGNVSAFTAASRDHLFDGTEGYKIIVDPKPVNDANHDVIVYMATSIGLYRSVDSGLTWTLMQSGIATDVVLAAGSASTTQTSTGNLQILYAAFENQGVYMADPAYAATSLVPLTGSPAGNGDFLDTDLTAPTVVKIGAPSSTPTGTYGRIVLATPTLTNNPLKDLNYEGWLYALVVSNYGDLTGLYMTKDFGQNWTDVLIPEYINPATGDGFPTNDYTLANVDPFSKFTPPEPAGGNYDVAMAIDPTNPNVVYIGGSMTTSIGEGGAGTGGFIRVDTTGLLDAGAIVAYNTSANDGGSTIFSTDGPPGNLELGPAGATSPVTGNLLGPGEEYGILPLETGITGFYTGGLLNVLRNPLAPFENNSVLQFTNVSEIENLGTGSQWEFLDPEILTNVHSITTFVDPITGETRLLVGDDQGVSTVLVDASGNIDTQIGSNPQALELPSLDRNGDLGSAQMVSTTTQPSQLAAEIAGAMFFGISRNNGFPISSAEILQTGEGADGSPELTWTGANATPMTTVPANGQWVVADPGGSGTVYEYEWPCCQGDGDPAADFFRVILPGTGPDGLGRTLFLVQPDDNPGTGQGDWPTGSWLMPVTAGGVPAVNPVDAQGLLLSAPQTGLVFRSTDEGQTWFVVGGDATLNTSPLDGSYAPALAFGAPNPANPQQLDNFLYAGTIDGNIFVSTEGGGTSWMEVSNGLDGSAVQQIIPDPVRGSVDAYAVTKDGVYYNPDTVAGDAWINVTGNLFSLKESIFGQTNTTTGSAGEFNAIQSLNTLAVDWTYAIPVNQAAVGIAKAPILYVGGEGGVFRSLNGGETWAPYPAGTTYSYTDPTTGKQDTITIPPGGYLPTVDVTQLTLSQGNINPTTGEPLQQTGGLNLLTAATFGRGTWVIRLGTPENDPAIAAIAQDQVVQQPGPQVIGVSVITQPQDIGLSALSEVNNTVTATTTGAFNVAVGDQVVISGVTPSGYDGTFSIASVTTVGTTVKFTYSDPVVGLTPATLFGLASVGTIDVEFNAPVLASTFTTGQIQITDSNGNPFTITSVTPIVNDVAPQGYPAVPGSPADYHNLFQVNFVPSSTMIASGIGTEFGQVVIGMLISSSITTGYTLTTPEVQTITNNATSGTFTLTFNGQTTPPLAFNATAAQVETALENLTSVGMGNVAVSSSTTSTGIVYTVTFPAAGTLAASTQPLISVTEPEISDYAGFGMDQDGTLLNGETITDPNNGNAAIDAYHGDLFVNSTGTAGNLNISMPTVTTAGNPVKVIVSDLDPTTGLPDPSYTGTVQITATINGQMYVVMNPSSLPLYTLSEIGNTVKVTASSSGLVVGETITISGVTTAGYNGTFMIASVTPTGFTYVDATGSLPADAFGGGIATLPLEAVAAQSATPLPVPSNPLPFTYTFTAADAGTHIFTIYFLVTSNPTTGQTLLSVNDTSGSPTAPNPAEAYITVLASYATHFSVTSFPNPDVAGTTNTFTVTALDAYGNISTSYDGTVTITSTDPLAAFVPTTYTYTTGTGTGFDNGVHVFMGDLETAGLQTITATDATNPNLTLTGSETILVVPATPTTIDVTGFPMTIVAGTPGSYTVSLYDAYGNLATNYTGTITLTSSDPKASFTPLSYTFTSGIGTGFDNGMHTFTNGATLFTAGTQSITATDTTLAISGSENGIIVNPAATSMLDVNFPSPVTAGTTHILTITAVDPYGNTTPAYTGTITITSSDPQATFIPTTYTFTSSDNGVHTFNGTLKTAGTQSITATDNVTPSITGTMSGIIVNPAAASVVIVAGFPTGIPVPDVAGTAYNYTVTLYDPYGNVATGYRGTVNLTSTDPQAVLTPSTYTFTAGDAGMHTFTGTLKTAGVWAITAKDAPDALMGSETGIHVGPASASVAVVTQFPSPDTAGAVHTFKVTMDDPYGNVATGYLGTIVFSSSDPLATFITPTYTFTATDQGSHTFTNGATLYTAGTQSITATDNMTPSITGSETGIIVNAASASTLVVSGFTNPDVAGAAHTFTVTAEDLYGNTAKTYTGTVHFTSTDGQAVLPANSKLTNGVGTFTATLKTAGMQSITATDTVTSTITGAQTGIMVDPAATSTFLITFPSPDTAGTLQTFTVTASDPYGNTTPTYTGTITLSSSDPQASFTPTTYTFSPSDDGVQTFSGTLYTAGTQSITATDTVTSTITGTETGIIVNPSAATSFVVSGFPSPDTAGVAHTFTVTAEDQFGNVATGYMGTVEFTSTDGQAVLPASTTLTNGVGTFSTTLKTSGTQSITATDTSNPTITGSENGILVNAAAASTVIVSGFPTTDTAGVGHTYTITLDDPYGNVATGYLGTVSLRSTDPQASFIPASYMFTATDAGTHTFTNGAILKTAGTQSITATDTVNSSLTGSESGIVVSPAATSEFVINYPKLVAVTSTHSFTVIASDAYGNNTPTFTGTVTLSSSDGQAVFVPTTYTFGASDNGVHTFNGTLNTPGTQSITAVDTANASIIGTETGIVVTPPVTQFLISFPTTVTAGTLHSFTVTAEDSHGNVVPTYTGTITLTSSDPLASFVPTTYTFLSTDNGVHSFSGTLDTAGMQTITATDTSDPARTGTDSNILVTAAAATTLSVGGFPNPDVAGVAHSLTVTLRDQYGNVATGYLGTVTLTSTDPMATFGTTTYTFTAADAGSHTFTNDVTLKTAGTWAISARDTSNSSLAATESGIVVTAAAASTVTLTGYPTSVIAGVQNTFTVTLRDAYGNLASGYVGTVVFTSSDPKAVFSQTPYTFTSADAGSRQFSASLQSLGSQSITVTDTSNPSLTGTESGIVVSPASVTGFTVSGEPTLAMGGTAFPITVSAVDQFGQTVPSFSGTVTFTSSDPYASLPTSLTLVDGVATAKVTLFTPAVRSITVTDTSDPSLTGTVNVNLQGGQLQPATVSDEYAAGAGTGPDVTLYNAAGTVLDSLTPFGPNYTDGVRTAVADFTLSGHPEIAVGTGPGVTAEVKVIDPTTGTVLFDIQPFGTFTGGVFVSEGDIKGDGYPDLIITPDQGGGPRVEIYHGGDFSEMANFYGINDPGFRGGARASAGDLTGDGYDDLVVSAGFSGGPRISIYDGKSLAQGQTVNLVNDFYAFSSELRNGAYVAVGAVTGGNQADLVFGAGPGGGPEVEIVSGESLLTEGAVAALASPIANYYTGLSANRGGARVTVKNLSGNGFADVVVGDGDLAGSSVRIYQGSTLSAGGIQTDYSFDAYPTLNAGVFVG